MLVRTWNVFHGNTWPVQRRAFLDEMVSLATADEPDVLCLQELPAGALGRFTVGDVAARPALGPVPIPAALGRALTAPNHGLLRSAFAGQGNAIVVRPGLRVLAHDVLVLNAPRFRAAQARWLGLGSLARLAWAKERRICQAVRLALPDGRTAVVANLHATSYRADERLADAELLRAATFADALARPGELLILAGDFNVPADRSRTLADLAGPEWGFSAPGPGIDQILVRGAPSSPPDRWPDERRTLDGRLLSDHSPVEVTIE